MLSVGVVAANKTILTVHYWKHHRLCVGFFIHSNIEKYLLKLFTEFFLKFCVYKLYKLVFVACLIFLHFKRIPVKHNKTHM